MVVTVSCGAKIYARSNPGEPPEYCTLFNHMVKSGGSTIKDKLSASAAADGVEDAGTCSIAIVNSIAITHI